MNFNTDPQLFVNLRKSMLASPFVNRSIFVSEGAVIEVTDGLPWQIARFDNSEKAIETLVSAGFEYAGSEARPPEGTPTHEIHKFLHPQDSADKAIAK